MRFPVVILCAVLGLALGAGPGVPQSFGAGVTDKPAYQINPGATPRPAAPRVTTGNTKSLLDEIFSGKPVSQEDRVREIQEKLGQLGYEVGVADGQAGPMTRKALQAFRDQTGAVVKGPATFKDDRALDEAIRVFLTYPELGLPAAAVTAKKWYDAPSGPGTVVRTSAGGSSRPETTRMFATEGEYPPSGFRGYGIIVFNSTATPSDRQRHLIMCEAYVSALKSVFRTEAAREDQFVTIWPVETPEVASRLNQMPRRPVGAMCDLAIDRYSRAMGDRAIAAARAAGFEADGVGPFLLGWLPGEGYGTDDSLMLTVDLSRVEYHYQARSLFQQWRTDIQSDERLLEKTVSIELLRRKIKKWADLNGPGLFSVFRGS